ncbi:MAG: cupin domain-containing protein [Opitutus sp.]|nr:cupin domain-containing protein [Opitutus sp.]
MNAEAQQLIAALGLVRLPHEGGWFRQSWRTAAGSAIWFLLTPEDFSALHRLRTDELWHFYAGDPVEHVQLDPRTSAERVTVLGPEVLAGQSPQLAVAGGVWQGARVWPGGGRGPATAPRAGWALLGCTMAPAWAEAEFELGARSELLRTFPAQAARVAALTR